MARRIFDGMEPDRAALRHGMVERQLRARGIRDETVLAAMERLPRELFIPPEMADRAYEDEALPIGARQTISQPYMVARMTELLAPRPGKRVLEVGTGSGYQAAVLAACGCTVFSVERIEGLAANARAVLERLDLAGSVRIMVGDGSLGRPEDAPFDGIVVTAGAPAVPRTLADQLGDGGHLVVPAGTRRHQELMLVVREAAGFRTVDCGPCVFVPLIGAAGYELGPPPEAPEAPEAAEEPDDPEIDRWI